MDHYEKEVESAKLFCRVWMAAVVVAARGAGAHAINNQPGETK
tara:strand:- start:32 stop:160 length:129 start_codon:yes stop_codon:yes gene_type:complete